MSVDFTAILARPLDEVKRPPVWPEGTYYGTIVGQPVFGESRQKATPQVEFTIQPHSFGDDILEPAREGIDLSKRTLKTVFYFTDASEYRLVEFLKSCGIKTSGATYDTTIPQTLGASVICACKHRLNQKDPEAPPFLEVDKIWGQS